MLFRLSRVLNRVVKWSHRNMKSLLILSSFLGIWLGLSFSLISSALIATFIYASTGGWRYLRAVIYTLPRDAVALYVLVKLRLRMRLHKNANDGVPSIFNRVCDKYKSKTCFIDVIGDKHWSFSDCDQYSNQVANYFLSLGLKPGDSVGILLDSSARYVCIWIGLAKIGVIPALLNFNLRGQSLAHCLEAANVAGVIYGAEQASAMQEAKSVVNRKMSCFVVGTSNVSGDEVCLDKELTVQSINRPPSRKYDFNSPLLYIYTSGTTGLPKAAKVVHSRYFYMAGLLSEFASLNSHSVIYDTLPLYHSAGGILGVGQALLKGSTVVIRKKFSASNFWSDCIKYECNAAQYIGEICRYLLAQPPKPQDRQHKVKVIYGNGLRPQIWLEFKNRFGIDWIREFYGATEGNANAMNSDNTVGCVGFTSVIAPAIHPISIILVDKASGLPLRGPDGLCIRAPPGESGELIGKINNNDPIKRFDGYSTKAATEKKIARDVFKRGDMYFLTGDILIMDELGYLYFKDRTGDTFRWKGENVSTAEVEATVSNLVDKRDVVAYGVEVPATEGRAGMIAIEDPNEEVDLVRMYQRLSVELPPYARPIFVRVLKQVDRTGTFKLKKVELRNDGYNPNKVSDRLFYLDAKLGQYTEITPAVYQNIVDGIIKF